MLVNHTNKFGCEKLTKGHLGKYKKPNNEVDSGNDWTGKQIVS